MKQTLHSLFSCHSLQVAKLAMSALIAICFTASVNAQDCDALDNLVLACNGNINVALNTDCEAQVTLDMMLAGEPWNNPAYPTLNYEHIDLIITVDGVVVPATDHSETTLTSEHLGGSITAMVTVPECGVTCWGDILLEDKNGMTLSNCFDYIMDCEEFLAGNSATTNRPDFAGNCTIDAADLSFEDDTTDIQCLNGYATTIERTWTALNSDGDFLAQCTQTINVARENLNDVRIPEDFIYDYTQNDGCEVFTDEFLVPSRTGFPVGSNCPNIMFFYNDSDFELCGVSRKILREWTIIDWCSGESKTEGQIIKVIDDQIPIIGCPVDYRDTLFFPATNDKCTADINLDPFDRAHGFGAMQSFIECSGFDFFVEYLPAEPGTEQPAEEGEYTSIGVVEEADGTYSLPQLSEGLVWIRYRTIDACGNVGVDTDPDVGTDDPSSCYFELQVVDTLPPTAICEGFSKVRLDATGHIEVNARSFDDHSFDLCDDIVMFEAKILDGQTCSGHSDDSEFGPTVHFCCANLGDTLSVMLRVYDETGRYSECESRVCVQEEDSNYTITCPDDITVSCGTDYEALSYDDPEIVGSGVCATGSPEITGVSFDDGGLDLCGLGIVVRTVTILLPSGQSRTCSSNITINQNDPLTINDISIDEEIYVIECPTASSGLTPEIIGGFPVVTNNSVCVSLTMDYEDQLLAVIPGSGTCSKIRRTWTVIDWCTYEANNGFDGFFELDQIILLNDNTAPQFFDPCVDITVNAEYPACEGDVFVELWADDDCTPAGDLHYTWTIDVDNDGNSANDINGVGVTIDVTLPGGVHKATYTVADNCGNVGNSCMFMITVTSDQPPVAICLANVVWVLDNNGEAEVWASDFDLKSEGSCGEDSDLQFSFTNPNSGITPNMTFTCADIPNGIGATIELEIFVIDASGGFESCVVTLTLQDNLDKCADAASMTVVDGKIYEESLEGIGDVEVEIYENSVSLMDMNVTANNGDYSFQNVPFYNGYMLKPYKEDEPLNGVTTLDIVLIQKHILGLIELDSPYKLIAADVNKSNSISAVDLLQIRKLILGVETEWENSAPWTFVPASHVFADVTAPWNYPEEEIINAMYVAQNGLDFYGVKMGDVNESVAENFANNQTSARSSNKLVVQLDEADLTAGTIVSANFRAQENVSLDGVQFTIEFDASQMEYKGYEAGAFAIGDNNLGLQKAHEGSITFSYDYVKGLNLTSGDKMFALNFEAKDNGVLSESMTISSEATVAEAYTSEGTIINVELETGDVVSGSNNAELFQNQPNPFDNSTEISFYLPEAGKANFEVMTSEGKVVYRKNANFEKGLNSIVLNGADLENKGVLLYRLEFNGYSETKKMIYIK